MSRYDFTSLSAQDFEELARDVLQEEWNVTLEAFKAGRDRGIDLRYATSDRGRTIVQCKHYAKSGFNKLLRDLRDRERPKIERLRPHRYVVVTSVELTPSNKDHIYDALQPFVLATQDIIGAQDLDGLLSRFPAIERANFKLWLTSTSVIERVLHNAELCQTDFQVDRIRRKLPVFVQSGAFPRAMQMLDERRIVIISGVPGIGKTTLAEMLLYSHLEQGYEPVVIRGEIAEGQKLFRPEAKRIFYYDDFLGQIFLHDRPEYFGRNQDVALIEFMEAVQSSAHARFVLTTRENFLSTALQMSERFAQSAMLQHRCILELRDYSFAHKARILYNHLYFSSLRPAYKRAVLARDFFLKIIKHEHFNPRLIEWLSTEARIREVPARQYRAYIARLLKSPHDIWNHAFRNQISDGARHILLTVYTLGERANIADLEPAFSSLHRYSAAKYHRAIAPGDFRSALQEVDGAFLVYSSGDASYLNPSIREFAASVILGDHDTAEDLLVSAVRFKQIANLWRLSESVPESKLGAVLAENPELLRQSLARVLVGPSIRWHKTPYGQAGYPIDMDLESRIGLLSEISERFHSFDVLGLAVEAADHLIAGWSDAEPDFYSVLGLLRKFGDCVWLMERSGRTVYRKILEELLNHLEYAFASDWLELLASADRGLEWKDADRQKLTLGFEHYHDHGVYRDRRNCTSVNEMNELVDSLIQLGYLFQADFSYEIDSLREAITEREETREPLSAGSGTPKIVTPEERPVTDDDVRQMFRNLVGEE